jgi:hypothetical protein
LLRAQPAIRNFSIRRFTMILKQQPQAQPGPTVGASLPDVVGGRYFRIISARAPYRWFWSIAVLMVAFAFIRLCFKTDPPLLFMDIFQVGLPMLVIGNLYGDLRDKRQETRLASYDAGELLQREGTLLCAGVGNVSGSANARVFDSDLLLLTATELIYQHRSPRKTRDWRTSDDVIRIPLAEVESVELLRTRFLRRPFLKLNLKPGKAVPMMNPDATFVVNAVDVRAWRDAIEPLLLQ